MLLIFSAVSGRMTKKIYGIPVYLDPSFAGIYLTRPELGDIMVSQQSEILDIDKSSGSVRSQTDTEGTHLEKTRIPRVYRTGEHRDVCRLLKLLFPLDPIDRFKSLKTECQRFVVLQTKILVHVDLGLDSNRYRTW